MNNQHEKVKALQALAIEHQARFYFNQRDRRFRLLCPGHTLHTFNSIGEAEQLLHSVPALAIYYGNREGVEKVSHERQL